MSRVDPSTHLIADLTQHTFASLVLQNDGPVVVEFMSYGCAHCGVIEPVLQKAAAMLAGKATVFRVNIGLQPGLAESYDIGGTPTFVMFMQGSEVGRVEGPRPVLSSLLSELTQPFEP